MEGERLKLWPERYRTRTQCCKTRQGEKGELGRGRGWGGQCGRGWDVVPQYMSAKSHCCTAWHAVGRVSRSNAKQKFNVDGEALRQIARLFEAETIGLPSVPEVHFFREPGAVGTVIHCRSARGSGGSVCLRMLFLQLAACRSFWDCDCEQFGDMLLTNVGFCKASGEQVCFPASS